ncbi:hypothetical protein SARC_00504 [Sphaeroforma arctica JP610]|uniref:Uncharacterized protein n=1 Tax=Sphaeroforma arctica JP610 TaxID=667725 RepID=A0A0L0GGC5_9EUKA|nr:hypothetical protein SARC_00504 [Sphaeroforma arctica JP610]KNC87363.1 hypothetical protein SARC_00504 [Sphaeroforma arctica JP610]|eukprot:XP_014161265.1 hypothetical protein SARC_00504 [Sphaeroforma arctica JP610]
MHASVTRAVVERSQDFLLSSVRTLKDTFVLDHAVFSQILLKFLISRLDALGGDDDILASAMLKLFKLVFNAVHMFPEQNEVVLQVNLSTIIMRSMTLATTVRQPNKLFLLLRNLFRSIGGGKFEMLYKEFLPLLPVLLERLNKLILVACHRTTQYLFVELCLTVPVRLSALLPYLHWLMRPLVLALSAGPNDLVLQGMRTLELCIDNLTPEYLDPIIAPVKEELLHALWIHIQPPPAYQSHAFTAMVILGKLGGRNRRALKTPPLLEYVHDPFVGVKCRLSVPTSAVNSQELLINYRTRTGESEDKARNDQPTLTLTRPTTENVSLHLGSNGLAAGAAGTTAAAPPAPSTSSTPLGDFELQLDGPLRLAHFVLTRDLDNANFSSPFAVTSFEPNYRVNGKMACTNTNSSPIATQATAAMASAGMTKTAAKENGMGGSGGTGVDLGRVREVHRRHALELAQCVVVLTLELTATGNTKDLLATLAAKNRTKPTAASSGDSGTTSATVKAKAADASAQGPAAMDIDEKGPAGEEKAARTTLPGEARVQREQLVMALMCVCASMAMPSLAEDATLFMAGVVRHFAILMTTEQRSMSRASTPPAPKAKPTVAIDSSVIVDVVGQCYTNIKREWVDVGKRIMDDLLACTATCLDAGSAGTLKRSSSGSPQPTTTPTHTLEDVQRLIFGTRMTERFVLACYRNAWYQKKGGTLGLQHLFASMPLKWCVRHQLLAVQGLVSLLSKADLDAGSVAEEALLTLTEILTKCNPSSAAPTPSATGLTTTANGSVAGPGSKVRGTISTAVPAPTSTPTPSTTTSVPTAPASSAFNMQQTAITPGTVGKASTTATSAGIKRNPTTGTSATTSAGNHSMPTHGTTPQTSAGANIPTPNYFINVVTYLVTQMTATKELCRTAVNDALLLLAQSRGVSVASLLTTPSVHGVMLKTVLPAMDKKSMRSLFDAKQVGVLAGLSACLSMRPNPPLTFKTTDHLARTVSEVLQQTDTDDTATNVMKPAKESEGSMPLTLLGKRYKVLAAAMATYGFDDSFSLAQRNRFISLFLMGLASATKEITQASHDGILFYRNNIAKDLLQTSLAPVLRSLADYRRLTKNSLDGLSRLLTLLNSCFNDTLGEKLLEHLDKFADLQASGNGQVTVAGAANGCAAGVAAAGVTGLAGGVASAAPQRGGNTIKMTEDMGVVASVIDIFHQLPPTAVGFMDRLVPKVLTLECRFNRHTASPFLTPLVRFFTRFPGESMTYLYRQLNSPVFSDLLARVFEDAECGDLKAYVAEHSDVFIHQTFSMATAVEEMRYLAYSSRLRMLALRITKSLMATNPLVLESCPQLLTELRFIWRRLGLTLPVGDVSHTKECQLVVDIHMMHIKASPNHPEAIQSLFDLVSVFTRRCILDDGYVSHFYFTVVPDLYTASSKKLLFVRFLDTFDDETVTDETKALLLQKLILPVLSAAFNDGDTLLVLDDALMVRIIKSLMDEPNPANSPDSTILGDSTRNSPLPAQCAFNISLGVSYGGPTCPIISDMGLFLTYHQRIVNLFDPTTHILSFRQQAPALNTTTSHLWQQTQILN